MSRREAELAVKEGRVKLNGKVCSVPSLLLSTEMLNNVHLDNVPLRCNYRSLTEVPRLWAVNKKSGELIAERDEKKNRPLLFNRILPAIRALGVETLVPVYRLPYVAEGMLFLTNDTKLCRMIQSEVVSQSLKLHYRVRIHGDVTKSKLLALQSGFSLNEMRTTPVKVEIEHMARTMSWLRIETSELDWRKTNTAFSALHLSVRRVICTGLGSYAAQRIIPSPNSDQLVHVRLNVNTMRNYLQLLAREAGVQSSTYSYSQIEYNIVHSAFHRERADIEKITPEDYYEQPAERA
eukprot:gene29346-35424_t